MLTRISNPQGAPWRLGDVKTEKSYISQPPQVGTKPYSTLVVHPKKNERSLQCDRWIQVERSAILTAVGVDSSTWYVSSPLSSDQLFHLMILMNTQSPSPSPGLVSVETQKKTRTVFGSLHFLVCSIICDTPKVGLIVLHSAFATVKFNWVMPNTYLTFHTKKNFNRFLIHMLYSAHVLF